MPRVAFSAENKVATTNYDYPKLKLKVGERARVIVGLEDPIVEYVHTLRKPQIVNGVPQMFTDKRRDGTEFEANKMDFISRPICLGDATVLEEKGSDPKNCPMCKLAQEHPDYTNPPQRRYAMHVIRYRTKGGTTDVATPFSVETLVWSFTDTIFNKISDFKEEWGDLRKHDLLLGPCQAPEHYQKFDITVAAKAAWLESEERKKLTAQTFKENQIPDLTIAAGAVKQKQWIEQDVASIVEAWAEVLGAETPDTATGLDEDLSGLLSGGSDEKWADGKTTAEVSEVSEISETSDEEDPLAGLDELTEPEEPAPVKKAASKKSPAKQAPEESPADEESSGSGVDNFDDLLADLG